MDIGTIAFEDRDGISTQGFELLFFGLKDYFSGGVFGGEMYSKISDGKAGGTVGKNWIHSYKNLKSTILLPSL